MLCTMPCLALAGGQKESEASAIELAENEGNHANDNAATEELLAKRSEEMRKIET